MLKKHLFTSKKSQTLYITNKTYPEIWAIKKFLYWDFWMPIYAYECESSTFASYLHPLVWMILSEGIPWWLGKEHPEQYGKVLNARWVFFFKWIVWKLRCKFFYGKQNKTSPKLTYCEVKRRTRDKKNSKCGHAQWGRLIIFIARNRYFCPKF